MAEDGFVVCNGRLAVGHVWGMEAWPSATNDLLTASIVVYIAASPACCEALLVKKQARENAPWPASYSAKAKGLANVTTSPCLRTGVGR